jgi:hypothetical protein
MGGKNFEFLLKQWNVYLSDTAVQRTTGATDFTLVKATDNLDDYALQVNSLELFIVRNI